jgi:hypothetical protein
MNALPHTERRTLSLVDIIDLKWLLACEGVYLHVERLQREPVYAGEMLAQAERSASGALRQAAERVRRHLGAPGSTR